MTGSGRDAARDELVAQIAESTEEWDAIQNSVTRETWEGTQQEHLADWLLSRGYRRSVTPQQREAAATAIDERLRPHTGALSGSQALGAADAAARAFGLEVTE